VLYNGRDIMPKRHADWLRQAKRDLEQARHAMAGGFHEWACFSAQQAAEKAVKALYQHLGADAWGHSVSALLSGLPKTAKAPPDLIDFGKSLDRHYIPPRYPNSFPQGIPGDYYTPREAEEALNHAQAILSFCEGHVLQ